MSGVVTLDGKPVEGATVTFVSDDGANSYSGSTDASGNYSLQSGEKVGALPGSYKVLVVKSHIKPSADAPDPSSADGMKMMKKEGEENNKMTKTGGANDMRSKMMGMGKMAGKSGGDAQVVKSTLPATYASATTSTLTAKVEAGPPVVKNFELKSK